MQPLLCICQSPQVPCQTLDVDRDVGDNGNDGGGTKRQRQNNGGGDHNDGGGPNKDGVTMAAATTMAAAPNDNGNRTVAATTTVAALNDNNATTSMEATNDDDDDDDDGNTAATTTEETPAPISIDQPESAVSEVEEAREKLQQSMFKWQGNREPFIGHMLQKLSAMQPMANRTPSEGIHL